MNADVTLDAHSVVEHVRRTVGDQLANGRRRRDAPEAAQTAVRSEHLLRGGDKHAKTDSVDAAGESAPCRTQPRRRVRRRCGLAL